MQQFQPAINTGLCFGTMD